MAFKIRRGTNAERLTITPAEGELIYTTDTKKLYVGDGTTVGGIPSDTVLPISLVGNDLLIDPIDRVLIGAPTAIGSDATIRMHKNVEVDDGFIHRRQSHNGVIGSADVWYRSRGNLATPQPVQAQDRLGQTIYLTRTSSGTEPVTAVQQVRADGVISGTIVPSTMNFYTTNNSGVLKKVGSFTYEHIFRTDQIASITANADLELLKSGTGGIKINNLKWPNSDGSSGNVLSTNGAGVLGWVPQPSLAGYATETYVTTAITNLVDGSVPALNTLKELATAIGDDANFASTLTTSLGNRLRVDINTQGLSPAQKANAVTNLGLDYVAVSGDYADLAGKPNLATVATSGSYSDLSNKPSIPAAQIQSDWTQTTNTALDFIKNKPSIPNLASVAQNILPATDITYDLGSPTKRFKDLYLSTSTLYLGDKSISIADNKLEVGGFTFGELGNVTGVSLTQYENNIVSIRVSTGSNGDTIANDIVKGDKLKLNSAVNGLSVLTVVSISGQVVVGNSAFTDYTITVAENKGSGLVNIEFNLIKPLFGGNYNDLTDKPTIPTDVSDLTDTTGLLGNPLLPPYKGFKAHYGTMYNNTGDNNGPINKIVIYRDSVSPSSAIDTDTSSDDFQVTGLTGSDVVAMLVIISDGTNWETQTPTADLKTFAEAIIDNVILDDGVEGDFNNIAGMRSTFYDNFSNFNTIIGDVKTNFEFFENEFNVSAQAQAQTGGTGNGFIIYNLEKQGNTIELNGWINGSGYQVGDVFTILGTNITVNINNNPLASPDNDVTVTITGVDGNGAITTTSISGTLPNIWPSYYINDGGDDEYDGANAIHTDLETNITYNSGAPIINSTAFGGGNYVVTYQEGIFGIFATGADIDIIGTSGEDGGYGNDNGSSGFDGDGVAVTGSLYGGSNQVEPTQIINNTYSVSVGTDGVVTMTTSRGGLEFGALPEFGGTTHFHIMRPAGGEGSDGTDLYFGDDFNYVLQRPDSYNGSPAYGVEIGANDRDGGNQQVWRFETDGKLTLPPDGMIRVPDNTGGTGAHIKFYAAGGEGGNDNTSATSGDIDITAGVDGGYDNDNTSNQGVFNGGNIRLKTSAYTGQPVNEWKFGWDGKLTAPGNLQVNGGKIILNSAGNAYVESVDYGVNTANSALNIFGGPYQKIKLRAGFGTEASWTFGTDGSLTLPQGSAIDETAGVSANIKVNGKAWAFGTNGKLTLPAGGDILNSSGNSVLGTDRVTGSWTLNTGANTVSLTVPLNGTYSIWVNGNIPNGIVTYTATVVVTNTNVPVLGSSYGWYYVDGNVLVLDSIPNQIIGTVNNISTATVATTTANVFTFGIRNNSATTQVVNWGYTKL